PAHPDERLLHQVLRPTPIPERAANEVQQTYVVPIHQLRERALAPGPAAGDDLAVVQLAHRLPSRLDHSLLCTARPAVDHKNPHGAGRRRPIGGTFGRFCPLGHREGARPVPSPAPGAALPRAAYPLGISQHRPSTPEPSLRPDCPIQRTVTDRKWT